MNSTDKIIEEKMKQWRERFTQESPKPEYREMKHEYYLNSTDVEQFLREALTEVGRQQREEEYKADLKEKLSILPREFWEDEDHAVGGYISKKDLYELLKDLNPKEQKI